MPKTYTYLAPARDKFEPNHPSLALRLMRARYIEPFPLTSGNRRYIVVETNYFTTWVEAKALANIRDIDVKKFVWKNIITRFGVP